MISQRTRDLIAESVRYCTWLGEKLQDERIEVLEHLAELSIESENLMKIAKESQNSLAIKTL